LERVADICARLWNEVNYERRRLSYEGRLTAKAMTETYKKYYEKYRSRRSWAQIPAAVEFRTVNTSSSWKTTGSTEKRLGKL